MADSPHWLWRTISKCYFMSKWGTFCLKLEIVSKIRKTTNFLFVVPLNNNNKKKIFPLLVKSKALQGGVIWRRITLGLEIRDWDGDEMILRETWTSMNPDGKSWQRWPRLKGSWRIKRGLSCQLHNWWPVQQLWPANTGRVTHEGIGWTGLEGRPCKSKN